VVEISSPYLVWLVGNEHPVPIVIGVDVMYYTRYVVLILNIFAS
jgi:hypothetical protein